MNKTVNCPTSEGSKFGSVDAVSDKIFEKVFGIDHFDDLSPEQTTVAQSRLLRVANYLIDAVPRFGASELVDTVEDDEPFNFTVMLEGSENDPSVAVSGDVGRRSKGAAGAHQQNTENDRDTLSYRAARRLSGLPEGIMLLEGRGTQYDERQTMSSIKTVMIEQKREASRSVFPDIGSITPSKSEAKDTQPDCASDDTDAICLANIFRADNVDAPKRRKPSSVLTAGLAAFITYTLWQPIDLLFVFPLLAGALFLMLGGRLIKKRPEPS